MSWVGLVAPLVIVAVTVLFLELFLKIFGSRRRDD